jgi:hypothetical protein
MVDEHPRLPLSLLHFCELHAAVVMVSAPNYGLGEYERQ